MSTPSEELERSLEELYDNVPCGLLSLLADGTIVKVNGTFLGWTGADRDRVLGAPFTGLLSPGGRIFYETRFLQALWLRKELREIAMSVRRADGTELAVLVNAAVVATEDGEPRIVRLAVFDATERQNYEHDLLLARRTAEASEARVRVLQEASSAFAIATTEAELALALVASAKEGFTATAVAVLLVDLTGRTVLAAGEHSLAEFVSSTSGGLELERIRASGIATASSVEEVRTAYPALAEAMIDARLEAFSIVALEDGGTPMGALICFFARQRSFDEHDTGLQDALGRQSAAVLARIRLREQLEVQAMHDQLTGLANRILLRERLVGAIGSALSNQYPMALIFVDLDGFKAVNDKWGHTTGDTVLKWVADQLRSAVRSVDVVGRFGGDEFVVICENASAHDATLVAERVLAALTANSPLLPGGVRVGASLGIALHQPHAGSGTAPETIFIAADAAMYRSKERGGGLVTLVEV